MSLEELPEHREALQIYARLVILCQLMCRAYTRHFENLNLNNQYSLSETVSPWVLSTHHLNTPTLLRWYTQPEAQKWGTLFQLVGEYLQLQGAIEEPSSSSVTPVVPIGEPLCDLIRDPKASEKEVFSILKK